MYIYITYMCVYMYMCMNTCVHVSYTCGHDKSSGCTAAKATGVACEPMVAAAVAVVVAAGVAATAAGAGADVAATALATTGSGG